MTFDILEQIDKLCYNDNNNLVKLKNLLEKLGWEKSYVIYTILRSIFYNSKNVFDMILKNTTIIFDKETTVEILKKIVMYNNVMFAIIVGCYSERFTKIDEDEVGYYIDCETCGDVCEYYKNKPLIVDFLKSIII